LAIVEAREKGLISIRFGKTHKQGKVSSLTCLTTLKLALEKRENLRREARANRGANLRSGQADGEKVEKKLTKS